MGQQIKLKTFRFIYSSVFIKELEYFSKIHQYDDRKTFKEEWLKWIEGDEINTLIENEINLAINQGYSGDIMDKMFKSARYYYRKKNNKQMDDEYDNKYGEEEQNFSGLSKEMIRVMDKHIITIINKYIDETNMVSTVNPATAFDDFCITHVDEITKEIFKLKEKIVLHVNDLNIKFKKSYKNRFYKIRILLNN
jgi:hypothetical protein